MPAPSKASRTPPPAPPQTSFPAIEAFVERASPSDVEALFAPLREGLAALKGPRAEQARKVSAALDRTEELLRQLLETREKLAADKRGKHR